MAKRPHEAAKMFAMYLMHAGLLYEYSKGNKPVEVTVSTSSLLVTFKAWFSKSNGKGTVIILEPCFVKKVISLFNIIIIIIIIIIFFFNFGYIIRQG